MSIGNDIFYADIEAVCRIVMAYNILFPIIYCNDITTITVFLYIEKQL